MDLAQRGAMTRNYQIETLRCEFEIWRSLTKAGQPLQKHNSQVKKITEGLENLLSKSGS